MAARPGPRDEERRRRGELTIFFGCAPGVGKTYAMLEAARLEREEGRDAVVGVVDAHGRYDTGALLLGLELLPRRKLEGEATEELDVDAALARRPELIVVDELAHTNAPGSRHAKRCQDVEELLSAGLDVFATLNVQHLESQSDVVAQVTHVRVRETVPDAVFESADHVRLIDLPIEELLARLEEGKVYVAEHAERARESFFREGNLIALRELALRLTAQQVDAQMRRYRERHGIERTWAVAERVLVCVSPSPASEPLVRGARRLAASLHADWIAAYVEPTDSLQVSAEDRRRVNEHLSLAQSLGAETVTLGGPRSPEEITRFAQSRNVTRILVGKPTHAPWRDRLRPSFVDQVVRLSGDIDVHVVTGESPQPRKPLARARSPISAGGLFAGFVAVSLATVLGKLLFGTGQLADVVMVYLLGIVVVSTLLGLVSSLVATLLSVLALNFFFVEPFHTLKVSDINHVATIAVMFVVAVTISGLTKRVRSQADAAREREIRTASLYSLSGALSRAKTTADVAEAAAQHIHDVFGTRAVVLSPTNHRDGHLAPTGAGTWAHHFVPDDAELTVAEWTWQNGKPAGAGTDTLPSARGSYLVLEASGTRVGVLGVERAADAGSAPAASHERRQHLTAFAGQIAGALERARLAEHAQEAQLRIETEQLRNSLLSSVSHDLRTPLAVITGAASTLLDARIEPPTRRELTETILTEAELLNRLVRNLLDMTRLEAGAVVVKKEWQPIEEAIGAALERVDHVMGGRPIETHLAPEVPLVPYDSILLQQVLVNLLENAAKYTPAGSPIAVGARLVRDGEVEIEVADRGPGLPKGEEARIFAKFHRAERGRGGVGLGLTICKGIVTAHGGTITAENRDGGGALFRFTLPIEGSPPPMDAPEPARAEPAQGARP